MGMMMRPQFSEFEHPEGFLAVNKWLNNFEGNLMSEQAVDAFHKINHDFEKWNPELCSRYSYLISQLSVVRLSYAVELVNSKVNMVDKMNTNIIDGMIDVFK